MMFKLSDREKMKGNAGLEKLNHRQSRVSLQSEYSPSSSCCFSNNGVCSSDDGSPFSTPFEEPKYQTPSTHYLNGLWLDSKSHESRFVNEKLVDDELGLCQNLYRMNIKGGQKDCTRQMRGFEMDPDGFGLGFGDGSLDGGRVPYNVEKYGSFDVLKNGGFHFDCEAVKSSPRRVARGFDYDDDDDDDVKSTLLGFGLRGGYEKGDSMGSYIADNQFNDLCSSPSRYNNQSNYLVEQRKEQGRSWNNRGIQLQNQSRTRPYLNDAFVGSQQCEIHSVSGRGVVDPSSSPLLMHHKLDMNVNDMFHNGSMLKETTRAKPNNGVPQSFMSMKGVEDTEAFSCEDSFIIQGKSLNYVGNRGRDLSRGFKKKTTNETAMRSPQERSSKLDVCNGQSLGTYCPLQLQPSFSSLAEVQGHIYFLAKDQNGCRFLQKVFDEGTCLDVQIIFNEIIDHVVELMIEPFGNYLVQKLLEVCNEEQRMQIVVMVTKEPGQLVKISLNTYGTRVVQKLIETLKTRQQIVLVKLALEPGFLYLIKDLNGNHVVQRCLQCLSNEDNKFIFDSAAKFCVDIATHRHGCCVLQRCIGHSTGEHRDKLITEISSQGLQLAQDPFGNYVIQYIIELKIPSAITNLNSQFKGHYVHLSLQKFSSHVVEKCLKHFGESRSQIVIELLSVPHFEQLLQDPFANYVIQSALAVTKGPLHASLVEAVRPHMILRTSPYCKRIFSRNLMKK